MKPGTIIRLSDGSEGTVVYHGLDGYGIQWDRIKVDADMIRMGNPFGRPPRNYPFFPEAMLRESYPGADVPCVGDDYEIVQEPQP